MKTNNQELDFAMGIYILILLISSIFFSYDYLLNKSSLSLGALTIDYFWFGICFYNYKMLERTSDTC